MMRLSRDIAIRNQRLRRKCLKTTHSAKIHQKGCIRRKFIKKQRLRRNIIKNNAFGENSSKTTPSANIPQKTKPSAQINKTTPSAKIRHVPLARSVLTKARKQETIVNTCFVTYTTLHASVRHTHKKMKHARKQTEGPIIQHGVCATTPAEMGLHRYLYLMLETKRCA